MSMYEEAKSGDRLQTLKALARHIGDSLDEAEPQAVAGLSREMRNVLSEIAELEKVVPSEKKGIKDELADLRAEREAARA